MARINNLTNFLTDVAGAIKEKTGDSNPIPASQFDTKIASITTGGNYQQKSLPISQNGNYTLLPDTGYDAMDSVSISVNVSSGSEDTILDVGNLYPTVSGTTLTFENKSYTQLEYIQSTGTQYIDTGFILSNNTSVEYDGYAISEAHMIGTTSSTVTRLRYEIVFTGSSQYRFQRHADINTDGYILLDKDLYPANIRHTWKMLKNKVYVDNTLVTTFTDYDMSGTDRSLCVFALNKGSETSASGTSRCYGVKIYENDLLVRNLIPVKRKSDNAICMYDLIIEEFFTNLGTGTFVAGPEK